MKAHLLILGFLLLSLVTPLAGQTDYVVGPQDVLPWSPFSVNQNSPANYRRTGRHVHVPQIGRIKAGGATLRNIETELKTKLADGYLKNPQVAVAIENYRSQRILVIGEVRNPGEYQLNGEMTLLSALARAGSTTPSATREATIVRPKRNPKSGEDRPGSSRSICPRCRPAT